MIAPKLCLFTIWIIYSRNSVKEVLLAVHEGSYNPFCEGLDGCQKNRTSYQKQGGLLEPLPIPT
jgi:hypothetical protein